MNAHLLTIGDELLIGQTVNTNAAWLGEQLSLLGADVVGASTVGDEAAVIRQELTRAFERADLVITTGGLGPTHDDVTKQVVADFLGVPLEQDAAIEARIEAYYADRGRTAPAAVRALAAVPRGMELLENPVGTAAGLWYADESGESAENGQPSGGGRVLVVLPGVPQEMRQLMEQRVLPRLEARRGLRTVAHRTLLTTGLPESSLQEKIGDLVERLGPSLALAYLPSTSGVRLRLTARGASDADVEAALDDLEADLRARIGRYVFGTGRVLLEAVVGQMLKARGLTVAAAESCTGGLVLHRLTNVPGASAYVLGGVVAYGNATKRHLLGVEDEALAEHGAVSEVVARQMARGIRAHLGADIGISTTGIAGPGGGSEEKPVGTVWIGYADAQGARATHLRFTQDRTLNKELFSTSALETIRRQLLRRGAA